MERDTEVGYQTVDLTDAEITEIVLQVSEILVEEGETFVVDLVCFGIGILVKGYQPALGEPVENGARVTAATEGYIDINPFGPEVKPCNALIQQCREMIYSHQAEPASGLPSSFSARLAKSSEGISMRA
jgi:hypothetical protein